MFITAVTNALERFAEKSAFCTLHFCYFLLHQSWWVSDVNADTIEKAFGRKALFPASIFLDEFFIYMANEIAMKIAF